MTSEYLPLAEYSTKYKVSISTLRRKIKSKDLQFVFSDNKYLILDLPPSTHQRNRPSLASSDPSLMSVSARPTPVVDNPTNSRQGSVVVERAPFFGLHGLSSTTVPSISTVSSASLISVNPPPASSFLDSRPETRAEVKPEVKPDKALFQSPQQLQEQFHLLKKKLSASKAHEETVIATANKLLGDLKKAYAQVLQEKEEQILNLRHEIADLKTLVQVLESENQRLSK